MKRTFLYKNVKIIFFLLLVLIVGSCGNDVPDSPQLGYNDTIQHLQQNGVQVTETDGGLSFWGIILTILITGAIAAAIGYFFYAFVPIKKWYEAWLSNVRVGWGVLIKMRFQEVPQVEILDLMIRAKNAGVSLKAKEMAEQYLAGVDIQTVTDTVIRAKSANIDIDFKHLAAQHLAQVDVKHVMHALIMAKNSDVDTDIQQLASFYLAGVDVVKLIEAKIAAKNSGYRVDLEELKEHYLAGGNLDKTVEAYVAARKANLPNFEFSDIAAIDLSGLDVIEAIHSAITPRVVETDGVRGVARDGVEITMKVKVTLRAFIKNIIGGVSEETVLARVNEGLATEIGLAESHYHVLQNPFELADRVENKNLHERSAFEIISIDVSDIEVGKDIHAELRTERAKAMSEEAKAELIRAEEKVQKAMAAAFLDGKLSIHDYHQLQNTEADTFMRKNLGNSAVKGDNPNSKENDSHHEDKDKKH